MDAMPSTSTLIPNPVAQQSLIMQLMSVGPKIFITEVNPILIAQEPDSYAPDGVIQVRTNYLRNTLSLDARNF